MKENNIKVIQLGGQAIITDSKHVLFLPDNAVEGQVEKFRKMGYAQMLSTGEFDFMPSASHKSCSRLIKKLPHGRVSETKDGAIQLTLKVFLNEKVNVGKVILDEALDGATAVRKEQRG